MAHYIGQWKERLTVVYEVAERMNEDGFDASLAVRAVKKNKKILFLGEEHWNGDLTYENADKYQTVTNSSDLEVKGSDYVVVMEWRDIQNEEYNGTLTVKGKDIPVHGNVKSDIWGNWHSGETVKSVKMTLSDEEIALRFPSYTGTGYEHYLNSKI